MASSMVTSSDSPVPDALQNTLNEIEKELESKYRLSTIHQGEAVYLVQEETGGDLRIHFSNETSINLDKDVFSQDLTVKMNQVFEKISEPRVLKIREKLSTPPQSPSTSQNDTTQEFVSLKEFRDFVKKIEEYQRTLLKEVKAVGEVIENSSSKIVNSLESNIYKAVQQLSVNAQQSQYRQFENSQIPRQNENQEISQFLSTKGFGAKDKSTCKPALLADTILRESIAEQRREWERRQAKNHESDNDDWENQSFLPNRQIFEGPRQDNEQRVLPFHQGFHQSSQPNVSLSDSKNLRPGDLKNPLINRDQCAKCGQIGHWSNDCKNQDTALCYKPFYHLPPGRNPEATRRDWGKRLVEDDGNSANKRLRTAETIPQQMGSRDCGPRPLFAPRAPDDFHSRGYIGPEPEVPRYRVTEGYNDRYAIHQQQYQYPFGQFGQKFSDTWNR